MSSALPTVQEHRLVRSGLLAALFLAAILVVAILIRYPGGPDSALQCLAYGIAALVILIGLGVWLSHRGAQKASADAASDIRLGASAGVVLGFLWVIEISFNNFVSPDISTGSARAVVDNGIWAAIGISMIAIGAVTAFRNSRVAAGARVGLWSGLVSGMLACLTALLLATIWMDFVLRDPLVVAEYAARGPASGMPNIATYEAYQLLAGAMLHLVVLGIGMGVVLGSLGGLAGSVIRTLPGWARRGTPNRDGQDYRVSEMTKPGGALC